MAAPDYATRLAVARRLGRLRKHTRGWRSRNPLTCWIWKGAKHLCAYGQGWYDYGISYIDGRQTAAHRAFWEVERGDLERGTRLFNVCGNTLCVRPSHWRAKPLNSDRGDHEAAASA